MKKILLVCVLTMGLAQSAFAIQDKSLLAVNSALLGTDNEKTKMVREGGATMRGDNQEKYELPEIFDEQKIVIKPRGLSIEQQIWENFSYPTPRFVAD